MPACPVAILTVASAIALPAAALGQYEITIEVESPTLLPGESTIVTMYAGFGAVDYAMAAVATDFVTSVGSDQWSDAMLLGRMTGPGTTPGTRSGTGYDGIFAGQLHGIGEIYGDATNPIAFWRATYTAPVRVVAPMDIDLSTVTSKYDVYIDYFNPTSEPRLAELVEGTAMIRVIPAPASALLLAIGLLTTTRRR